MQRTTSPAGQEVRTSDAVQKEVEAASNKAEIQQAIVDAEGAVRDAAAPGSQPIYIPGDGSRPFSLDMKNGNLIISQEGNTKVIPWRDAVPAGAVQIAWAIPATLSILLIWWPLTRAVAGWIRRRSAVSHDASALEARLQDRFAAMETNIDTVAVEMERLAEGQRFAAKLLADRPAVAVPATASR